MIKIQHIFQLSEVFPFRGMDIVISVKDFKALYNYQYIAPIGVRDDNKSCRLSIIHSAQAKKVRNHYRVYKIKK
jgi:hypothetical protein